MTDKALIEKAKADYWKRKKLIAHEHKPKTLVICSFQDGATWQREQLEAEIKQDAHGTHSGNTGGKMSNEKKQYENAVWSSLNKIKELEAEIKELKERCERYIWNLGGVSTLLLGYSIDEFNKEYALPALTDTNEFVKKYQHLQAENKTIREQIIKELREWVESNKELRGYTGIPDDTLNIILAKLDLLEGKK